MGLNVWSWLKSLWTRANVGPLVIIAVVVWRAVDVIANLDFALSHFQILGAYAGQAWATILQVLDWPVSSIILLVFGLGWLYWNTNRLVRRKPEVVPTVATAEVYGRNNTLYLITSDVHAVNLAGIVNLVGIDYPDPFVEFTLRIANRCPFNIRIDDVSNKFGRVRFMGNDCNGALSLENNGVVQSMVMSAQFTIRQQVTAQMGQILSGVAAGLQTADFDLTSLRWVGVMQLQDGAEPLPDSLSVAGRFDIVGPMQKHDTHFLVRGQCLVGQPSA